jgi:hypothetical protein
MEMPAFYQQKVPVNVWNDFPDHMPGIDKK